MSAPRRCPALLAYGLACALLAAQWALAAYRCPLEVRTASMEAMRTIGLPCDEIDEHERVLCHRHLVQAPQSLEGTKTPLPTLPDVAPWRSVPEPAMADAPGRAAWTPLASGPGPPADPVYLATLRLRI